MTDSIQVETLRAWSYRRQRLDRPESDLMQALRDVVAVYSSNPTAPLSLLARAGEASAESFQRLERERRAIRLPGMRGSIFFVPTDTASIIFAATRTPIEKLEGRLEYGELTWEDYARIKQAVLDIATRPLTTAELQEAIPTTGKLMVAVRLLAMEGLVLRVGESLRSDTFRYVSTSSWLGAPLENDDPEQALAWLAERYLGSFGPARIADFAWWAGVTKGRAKKAMAAVDTVDLAGGLLLRVEDEAAFRKIKPLTGDEIALLPKWDPYTMGYPADGRARFVRDEHQELAYPKIRATRGDGAPLVLRGGQAVATWGHRFNGERLDVTVTPFERADTLDWLTEEHFSGVARLLGAVGVDLSVYEP